MRLAPATRALVAGVIVGALVQAQVVQSPPISNPAPPQQPAPPPQPARPAGQPPAAAPKPAGQTPAPGTTPQIGPAVAPALSDSGGFLLDNVSLVELVDILARRLKINYILDPRVNGK